MLSHCQGCWHDLSLLCPHNHYVKSDYQGCPTAIKKKKLLHGGVSGNLKKEKVHQVGYMRHEQMACWKVDFLWVIHAQSSYSLIHYVDMTSNRLEFKSPGFDNLEAHGVPALKQTRLSLCLMLSACLIKPCVRWDITGRDLSSSTDIFRKFRSCLKFRGDRRVARSQFHIEHPPIFEVTVKNLVARAIWRPRFVRPRIWGIVPLILNLEKVIRFTKWRLYFWGLGPMELTK